MFALLYSLVCLPEARAFVQTMPNPLLSKDRMSFALASSSTNEDSNIVGLKKIDKPAPKTSNRIQSRAIPFLEMPATLQNDQAMMLAGNFGFDPLGLAKNLENLMEYRESEVKHARLAMLAAAGWPLSELYDRAIAEWLGLDPVLDQADRAPSLLNGGLEKVSPIWWGACVGFTAAIDLYGIQRARSGDPEYLPGRLGFDPLGFYPPDMVGRSRMELAEIKHGRIAMLAVVGYSLQEYTTQLGVVDETPFFFTPITDMLSRWDLLQ